jgi:hypothetical protein
MFFVVCDICLMTCYMQLEYSIRISQIIRAVKKCTLKSLYRCRPVSKANRSELENRASTLDKVGNVLFVITCRTSLRPTRSATGRYLGPLPQRQSKRYEYPYAAVRRLKYVVLSRSLLTHTALLSYVNWPFQCYSCTSNS